MGVNIIDTSANYADGNSERLIGEVLKGVFEHGIAKREEMIVVSKGGYLQGENFNRMKERMDQPDADFSPGSELSEMTTYSQGLWHSIHPNFLKDQITLSLDRMQLEVIDVYLLHNPEYYIQWAIKEGVAEDEARAEYERRIKNAFAYLESEVAQGRIGAYGISSNTFPRPEESIDRTSLERCWQSAEVIKREQNLQEHHFSVIQLPLNIFEHQGATEKNQLRSTKTTIEFARQNNIGVLINRPLNAIVEKGLRRLADFPEREFPPVEDITDIVHDLKLQEEEFKGGLLKDLAMNPQAYDAVKRLMSLGTLLDEQWQGFHSYEEWRDASQTILAPRVQYCFDVLRPISKTNKQVFDYLAKYAESADEVMEHVNNYYVTQASERSNAIHRVLDQVMPDEYEPLSLSQKAVLLIRSIPGVSSVLVGMRTEDYVDDTIFGLQAAEIPNVESVWEKLAAREA